MPIIPQHHNPTDVVSPLICPFELKKMDEPDNIAILIIMAPLTKEECIYSSIIPAVVVAKETIIKVLRPAECLLLDLSNPMIAERNKGSRQIGHLGISLRPPPHLYDRPKKPSNGMNRSLNTV